jgi:uncharacterized protein DUF397
MPEAGASQRHWRRSSLCDTSACVEVAVLEGLVRIRNSNDPAVTLSFTATEWSLFTSAMMAGEFADLNHLCDP